MIKKNMYYVFISYIYIYINHYYALLWIYFSFCMFIFFDYHQTLIYAVTTDTSTCVGAGSDVDGTSTNQHAMVVVMQQKLYLNRTIRVIGTVAVAL